MRFDLETECVGRSQRDAKVLDGGAHAVFCARSLRAQREMPGQRQQQQCGEGMTVAVVLVLLHDGVVLLSREKSVLVFFFRRGQTRRRRRSSSCYGGRRRGRRRGSRLRRRRLRCHSAKDFGLGGAGGPLHDFGGQLFQVGEEVVCVGGVRFESVRNGGAKRDHVLGKVGLQVFRQERS